MKFTAKKILLALLIVLFFSVSAIAELPDKLFDPFSFGQIQDTVTLLKYLEKNNVSIDEFIKFVEKKIKIDKVRNLRREALNRTIMNDVYTGDVKPKKK